MICQCPLGAALPTIPVSDCPQDFGQIQKVIFQRMYNGTTLNTISGTTAGTLATWQTNLTASDGKKMIVSPYIQAPTTEAGDPITFGGGNDTVDGIEEIVGTNPTTFSGVIRKSTQDVIKELKKLGCENIGVYLIDQHGRIGAIKTTSGTPATTTWSPIPLRSFFVGDKTFGGLNEPDGNVIQWSFVPNWSDNFDILVPNFNPLTELKAA